MIELHPKRNHIMFSNASKNYRDVDAVVYNDFAAETRCAMAQGSACFSK